MNALDTLYSQFLTLGFVVLRQAADAGDAAWIAAEIELLHNVPSLIGESNAKRHEYFWRQERTTYLAWVNAPGRELQRSRMETFYEPIWEEIEGYLLQLGK
jgi:hypothetical protein